MNNSISYGIEALTVTSSTTFGVGSFQTPMPRLCVYNGTSGGTLTLPVINTVNPTPPGTPGTSPGVGDGALITINNIANKALTIAAGGSDTAEFTFVPALGALTLIASAAASKWYSAGQPDNRAVRSVTAAATISPVDRIVSIGASVSVTLPAATAAPVGQPIYVVSAGSFTPTIVGTISGVANITMAANTMNTLITDGTLWYYKPNA